MNGYLQDICGYLHISEERWDSSRRREVNDFKSIAYKYQYSTGIWYGLYQRLVHPLPSVGIPCTGYWYFRCSPLLFPLSPLCNFFLPGVLIIIIRIFVLRTSRQMPD